MKLRLSKIIEDVTNMHENVNEKLEESNILEGGEKLKESNILVGGEVDINTIGKYIRKIY